MKSEEQIKSYIVQAMQQHGQQPRALLHILTGYVAQLQEEMLRETVDTLADRVCAQLHPGKAATGVYCRLCHDHEMAGRYGSIPGQAGPLAEFPEDTVDMIPPLAVPPKD